MQLAHGKFNGTTFLFLCFILTLKCLTYGSEAGAVLLTRGHLTISGDKRF